MVPVASGTSTRRSNQGASQPDAPPGIRFTRASSLGRGRVRARATTARPKHEVDSTADAAPVTLPARPSRKGKEKALNQDGTDAPQYEEAKIQHGVAPRKSAVKGSSSRFTSTPSAAMGENKTGTKKVRIDVAESSSSAYSPSSNASAEEDADEDDDHGDHDDDEDADAEAEADGEGDESEAGPSSRRHKARQRGQVEEVEAWDWDWAEPSSLPIPGSAGRRRELKYLDEAIYKSALFDATEHRVDLARMLLEWQALKSRQKQVESNVIVRDGVPRDSTLSGPLSEQDQDEDGRSTTSEPEGPTVTQANLPSEVPMPAAAFLEKMARWPLHPSRLPPQNVASSLEDAFEDLVADVVRDSALLNSKRPDPSPPRPRVRSAYQANEPFAIYVEPPKNPSSDHNGDSPSLQDVDSGSIEDDDDDNEELTSSLDDPLDEVYLGHPQISCLLQLLKKTTALLIEGMMWRVPLGPPPPMDFYQQTGAVDPIDLPRAIGWETVLDVAKGIEGISPSVIEELEQSMTTIYGPTNHGPHPVQVAQTLIPPRKVRQPKHRDPNVPEGRKQNARARENTSSASDEGTTYRGKRKRRDLTESIEHGHKRPRRTRITRSRSASQVPSTAAGSEGTDSSDDEEDQTQGAEGLDDEDHDGNDEKEVASSLSSLWVADARTAPP
ncbi:BQ2448_3700 [Microbotryum intermedium]|uniref:BQ2448_3700 protein n=1 Tax=Microbotryum intermedium TaxID=269621 RepID=A0A238FIC8_9BASI|nr:BQ2448_3700 [Microbotryum intermedium]